MTENSLYNTALSKCMSLCSQREYCRSDIENKLDNWGVNKSDAQKIINTLISENFLNEERYAKAFVTDKFNYNKWGKIKISYHLKSRKVSENAIRLALNSIDNEEYKDALKDLIKSHRRSIRAKNSYDLKAKLLRFGQSRGFEAALLYDLLNEIEKENP